MRWLWCVAQAVVKGGIKALANLVPFGSVMQEVASEAYVAYRQQRLGEQPQGGQAPEASLPADIQAVAAASEAEVKQVVAQVVQATAGAQSPQVQQALVSYLSQVPAAIR